MTVQEIISVLELEIAGGVAQGKSAARQSLEQEVTGGYASDLLSCVMAGASEGNVWVTLQAHPNVVAVADLLGLSCVIVTEGIVPDEETLSRANEKGIVILLAKDSTFTTVGRLAQLGVRGAK